MALSFGGTMDDSSIQTEMENGSTAAITFNNPTLHTYTTYPSEHSFGTKVESMINRIRRRRLQGLFIIMLVAHAFVRVEAIAVRADALNSRRHIIQKSSPDVIQRKQNQRRLPKRSSGGGHSGYLGCLGYSSSQLRKHWIFGSNAPTCGYTHHSGKGGRSSGGSSSGSSGSGGSGSGGSGSGSSSGGSGNGSGGSSSGGTSSGGSSSGGNNSSNGGNGGNNTTGRRWWWQRGNSGGKNNGGNNNGGGSNNSGGNAGGNNNNGGGNNNNSGDNGGGNYNGNGNNNNGNNGGDVDNYNGGGNQNQNGNYNGGNGANNNNNGGRNYNNGNGYNGNNGGNGNNYDSDVTNNDFENVEGDDDAYNAAGDQDNYDDFVENGGAAANDDVNQNNNGSGNANDDNNANAENGDGENQNQNNNDDGANGQNNGGNNNNNNYNNDDEGYQFDPYDDFEISQCDTYENLWLWDLSLTCESESSLDSCECIFAEELIEMGYLSCSDKAKCPSGCQICTTCFKLMGCTSGNFWQTTRAFRRTFWIFASLAVTLSIFAGYFYARKLKRKRKGGLEAHLMHFGDLDQSSDNSSSEPDVWLAPDMPATQFKPSFEAAVLSSEVEDATNNVDESPYCLFAPQPKKSAKDDDNVWLAPVAEDIM